MKKFLLISTVFALVCGRSYATRPFPPKLFADDGYALVVGFAWPDQNNNVLVIRTMQKLFLYGTGELGLPLQEMSTAGNSWCQQSIGYVTTVKMKEEDVQSSRRVFYFRHRSGKEIIIDLNSGRILNLQRIMNTDELRKRTISAAASLLKSQDSFDRQTAAIHLGQLKSVEHEKELRKLLEDNSSCTVIPYGGDPEKVYYVRDAAKKALQLIQSEEKLGKGGAK